MTLQIWCRSVFLYCSPGKMGLADDTNWALVITSEWLQVVSDGGTCNGCKKWPLTLFMIWRMMTLLEVIQMVIVRSCSITTVQKLLFIIFSSASLTQTWLGACIFCLEPNITHVVISYLVVTACQTLSRLLGFNCDPQPSLDTLMFTSCYHWLWLLRSVSGSDVTTLREINSAQQ